MPTERKTAAELRAENQDLRARLQEAEETLRAIREGEVDALVVGDKLYTLQGIDAESNRFRGEILAQVHEAVIGVDRDRRVIYLNPAAERQYGIIASKALGKRVEKIYRTRWNRPEEEAAMHAALRAIGHWRGENIHVKRDGEEFHVESSISCLVDSHGTSVGVLAVIRDISERKRLESELAAAKTQCERHAQNLEILVAQRTTRLNETVQELEAFSFTIAHDMRAPLRAMQGFSKILVEEYRSVLDDKARMYLDRIRTSADRLDQLIQDVLNYSRIVRSDLVLTDVDTARLLKDILTSYPNLRFSNVDIEIVEPLPMVHANPAALTQVFSNLLGNAVKFVRTNVKPAVKVWAEERRPAARSERLSASTRPRRQPAGPCMVRLWFEDNGIGIDEESRLRIFAMFQRLNRPELYEGTGMGLAIVRKAVTRMGGRVGVESEVGQGSRFWVDLKKA